MNLGMTAPLRRDGINPSDALGLDQAAMPVPRTGPESHGSPAAFKERRWPPRARDG